MIAAACQTEQRAKRVGTLLSFIRCFCDELCVPKKSCVPSVSAYGRVSLFGTQTYLLAVAHAGYQVADKLHVAVHVRPGFLFCLSVRASLVLQHLDRLGVAQPRLL